MTRNTKQRLSWKERIALGLVAGAAVLFGLLLTASPARSATALMSVDTSGVHVRYDADPGEENDVTISNPCWVASGSFTCVSAWDAVDISDSGATTLNARWNSGNPQFGCITINSSTVRCMFPANPQGQVIDEVTLNLSDSDDFAVVDDSAWTFRTTIRGGSDDDWLIGGRNRDRLEGGGDGDTLDGRGDADILDGGIGWDTVDYSARMDRVEVSLDGSANDGKQNEGDYVRGTVEVVEGGSSADILVGNGSANGLYGGPGNDTLDGNLGADVLFGGAGSDTVEYRGRTADLFVTIGGAGGAPNEGDLVSSDIEVVFGAAGNDHLVGDSSANTLIGGSGNDTLDGGDGDDQLFGGPHDDTLNGGAGRDYLVGGLALDGGEDPRGPGDLDNDTLNGGAGDDSLFGKHGDDQIDALDSDIGDKVDCGPGTDSTLADFTRSFTRGSFGAWVYESVVNCETVTWTRVQPLADPVEPGISVPGDSGPVLR